ncbi:MAG: DUF4129 domain-containing transglutaminase family protein [Armatimonadota bacterium]
MAVPILKETPITTRESVIPYLMSGLNMLAPTLVAKNALTPQILLASVAMILMGLPWSVYFRQRQYNRIALNIIVQVPLLIFTWLLVRSHPGMQIDWSNPIASIMGQDLMMEQLEAMLCIFVLLSAGRAFLLVTQRDLLQTPIPSISIFLLAVITGPAQVSIWEYGYILLCLLVLFASSLYLFSHDHSQQWFSIHTPVRVQWRLITWMAKFALLLFPLVIVAGWFMQSVNMYSLASAIHDRPFRGFHMPSLFGGRSGVSFTDTVDVGGGNWPSGKQRIMTVTMIEKEATNLLWRAGTYTIYVQGSWKRTPERSAPSFLQEVPFGKPGSGTLVKPMPAGIRLDFLENGPQIDPGIAEARREVKAGQLDAGDIGSSVGQSITVDAPVAGIRSPIYGAYQIMSVFSENGGLLQHAFTGSDGHVSVPVPGGTRLPSYDITSIIKPLPTTLRLKRAIPLPPEEHRYYTSVPKALQEKVREKALQILKESRDKRSATMTEYDIVRQFEYYLGQQYSYTLKPSPPPRGVDPVIDFLYTQKQGYCNYFSSAMVLLCRSVGIPARFVVGFATGERQENKNNDDEGKVTYLVTTEDAHSWVEVYLPHYGWYTSDPTAGSREVPTFWSQSWDLVTSMVAIIKTTVTDWMTILRQDAHKRAYLELGFAVLLVLTAFVVYWRRERPPTFPKSVLSPNEALAVVLHAYERMHRWLTMWGVIKPYGLTAGEFDRLFQAINPPMGAYVSELSALYIRAQYGAIPLTDADARRAITLLHQLWEAARTERRHFHVHDAEEAADA